jgi:hypothetical protein
VLEQVLEEVEAGIDLIRRQDLARAGNRLNGFRAEVAAG